MKGPSLTVDLGALQHNVRSWKRRLGDRGLWAVVKSDGYRMGMLPAAKACVAAGAERLCVIDVAEASALRAGGLQVPIVQICTTPLPDLETALHLGVIVTVDDVAGARELARLAAAAGVRAKAHVAVDTGSGWSGVVNSGVEPFARAAAAFTDVEWEGAWTHIAGQSSLQQQLERFESAVAELRANGLRVPLLHVASTGPLLWGITRGAARVGVGLYGSTLGGASNGVDRLRTAVTFTASISTIRTFDEPTPLGYGGIYVAAPGETVATLRVGYGDGLPRSLAGEGAALLKGRRCPIVGAIGMNYTMVSAPAGVEIESEDEALLLGEAAGFTLDEVAANAGMIPHNLLTALGSGAAVSYLGA